MSPNMTMYKLLAVALCRPDKDLLEALRASPLFQTLLSDVSVEAMQKEHTRLFSLTVAGGIAPYETEYGIKGIFMKTQQMADVAGFYRAFGFEVDENARERIDFIGAELELMHWLTLKEEHASAKDQPKEARICRDAAANFLDAHLGRWAPFFGEQLETSSRSPFYRELGRQLHSFIRAECRRLGVTPKEITNWEPPLPTAEPSCDFDGCGGAADLNPRTSPE